MKIKENITRAFHMAGLKLVKRSPEIMVVTGVIGAVVGTVMACKATLKLDGILSEAGENIERVNTAKTGTFPKVSNPEVSITYTEKDRKRDLAIAYIQAGVKVAKLYAPAALVMSASVGAIFTGHGILRKRNVALAAAYATVDKSFKEYRKGVIDKFGSACDDEMKRGIKAVEVTETVTNEKTGEPTEVKKTVDGVDRNYIQSEYARQFDKNSRFYNKNPEYSRTFLDSQQQYANDLLRSRGYLFLSEVYGMLGFKPTKASQCVGWIYDKKNPSGDNFVDFGIREAYEIVDCTVGDYNRVFLLDFNVDGSILDRI